MIKLTKAELLYDQLWPTLMGLAVGLATVFVHRARSGALAWGLVLAWVLIIAAGIYMRAGRGRSNSTTFTIVVIALPFAIAAFSSNAKLLLVSDWRTYTWLIGHVVFAVITRVFGNATRQSARSQLLEAPAGANRSGYEVGAVADRNEGDHVNR